MAFCLDKIKGVFALHLRRFAQFNTIFTVSKNVKNTHSGALSKVPGFSLACNFIESNTQLLFFMFFKYCANGTKLREASHLLNVHITFLFPISEGIFG